MNQVRISSCFQETIREITKLPPKCFGFVYLSLGSKINESIVSFNNSDSEKTNAGYQMIPRFLQNPEIFDDNEEKAYKLIVLIDKFNNQDIKNNQYALTMNMTSLTRIYIVNTELNNSNINKFDLFLTFISSYFGYLGEEKFMVCNFIKYLNQPNLREENSQRLVIKHITDTLNVTKFKNSYYEWFGYKNKLYNYFYNKNKFSNMLNYYRNIILIEKILQKNKASNKAEEEVSKYVYNLLEFENHTQNPTSLYETIQYLF